jgi:hypothetical protein
LFVANKPILLAQIYTLKTNNLFVILWHTIEYYPGVGQWPNSPWPLASSVKTMQLVVHILKAKCLDHPNLKPLSNPNRSRIEVLDHI